MKKKLPVYILGGVIGTALSTVIESSYIMQLVGFATGFCITLDLEH